MTKHQRAVSCICSADSVLSLAMYAMLSLFTHPLLYVLPLLLLLLLLITSSML